jgi:flagellar hook-associated protein 3 FlgL
MRVATSFFTQHASADLQRAQLEMLTAQRQASTERKASDLKGYERDADSLISSRGFLERADAYVKSGAEVLNRIDVQDLALSRTREAGDNLRLALTDAVGLERGDEVMTHVETAFFNALGAMKTTYAGKYVFGGVRDDTSPVNVNSLNALEAAPTVDDIFDNAPRRARVQIDPQNTIEVGPLANDVSRDLFDVLKRIKAYVTANGQFSTPMTSAQRTFLQTEIGNLVAINKGIVSQESLNGAVYQRADTLIQKQTDQRDYYDGLVADIQHVDLAEVATRLNASQLQLEASARVFGTLSQSSLLNYL